MTRFFCWVTLILLPCTVSVAAGASAASQPSTRPLDQLKDDRRREVAALQQHLPLLPALLMEQIIRFRMDGDSLTVDSPVEKKHSFQNRVPLQGTDEIASVTIKRNPDVPQLHTINFEVYDFSDPTLIDRHLQVLSVRWVVSVVEDREFIDHIESVSLTETTDPGAAAAVTLRVQILPENDQISPANVPYTGDNIWALRSQHPAEVERFLRPMFRDFGQEPAAFAIDDKIAWLVLDDLWTPPKKLAEKVQSILNKMNADDYTARDAAQKELESLGQPAALYLLNASPDLLTPEQQARVEKFLAPYRLLSPAQVDIFRHDVNFLLDCLYNDDPAIRAGALDHLRRIANREIKFETDQPLDNRIAAIRLLRDELSPVDTAQR